MYLAVDLMGEMEVGEGMSFWKWIPTKIPYLHSGIKDTSKLVMAAEGA
jgi:hypothetical protein